MNPFRKSAEMPEKDVTITHKYELNEEAAWARFGLGLVITIASVVTVGLSLNAAVDWHRVNVAAETAQLEAQKAMFESMKGK
jgi:hypothetical protein